MAKWAATLTFFVFVTVILATVEDLEALLRPVVDDLGYELVDVQLRTERGRAILRLLVDRPGGITLGECARLSREVGPHLEVADPIRGAYSLEVSSPGVQRPLKREEDFVRFQGERVVVRTLDAVDGRKTFRGTLVGVAEGTAITVLDRETQTSHDIPLSSVKEAHLDPELPF